MSARKTPTQLLLAGLEAGSEANPTRLQSVGPHGSTEHSEADRKREYHRKWREANREKWREYSRRDYLKNRARFDRQRGTPEYRARLSIYLKGWRTKNAAKVKIEMRKWYDANKHNPDHRVKMRALARKFYQRHKATEVIRRKIYAKNNPEKIRARFRKLRRTSVQFNLRGRLRTATNRAFRRTWIRKPYRTEALLGCTMQEARLHIEGQFRDGMGWLDRGSFVIDHWVPISVFDLADTEEAMLACNWKNLRPLTPAENSAKSDKLPEPIPDWLPAHIAERVLRRRQPKVPQPLPV